LLAEGGAEPSLSLGGVIGVDVSSSHRYSQDTSLARGTSRSHQRFCLSPGFRERRPSYCGALNPALWLPPAPSLLRAFGSKIIDFACVNVENDLSTPCVRVLDHYLRGITIVNLLA
jgi:hypothetical protein